MACSAPLAEIFPELSFLAFLLRPKSAPRVAPVAENCAARVGCSNGAGSPTARRPIRNSSTRRDKRQFASPPHITSPFD